MCAGFPKKFFPYRSPAESIDMDIAFVLIKGLKDGYNQVIKIIEGATVATKKGATFAVEGLA